jgi:hypothetical protein
MPVVQDTAADGKSFRVHSTFPDSRPRTSTVPRSPAMTAALSPANEKAAGWAAASGATARAASTSRGGRLVVAAVIGFLLLAGSLMRAHEVSVRRRARRGCNVPVTNG